jgi:class 3 adenylate cyclase
MSDLDYATTDDGSQVAYRVLSTGFGQWCVWIPGLLYSIESIDDDPPYARFMHGLTEVSNVVVVERQGIGASDMVDFDGNVHEQWADGVAAVLSEVGVTTATIAGYAVGAATAVEFGLRHPDKTSGLILMHLTITDTSDIQNRMIAVVARDVEESDAMLSLTVPSRHKDPEFLEWMVSAGRRGASPRTASRYWQAVLGPGRDILERLKGVQPRTLVLQRRDLVLQTVSDAKRVVEAIPDATLALLDGADMTPNAGDIDALIGEIAEFITGERRVPHSDRPIAALLFTDIVDSTKQVAAAGDNRWSAVLDKHDALVRRTLSNHGGDLVKSTGDGILATFDTASRAIEGARDLRSALRELDLDARMGIHVTEVDVRGADLAGVGVHLAARIMGHATAGQILVSTAVVQITLGSEFSFAHHESAQLKGLDGSWDLFRLS